MRTGTRRLKSTGWLAFGLATLVAVGCDKVPLTAPQESTVTLTTTNGINGNTQVLATVLEQAGTPVQNGTTVRFSSTLGRMDPAETQTRDGMASSTLVPGSDNGEATVTVFSGTATANTKILLGSALVDSVSVRSSSGSVPATGGTVEITARVANAGGRGALGCPGDVQHDRRHFVEHTRGHRRQRRSEDAVDDRLERDGHGHRRHEVRHRGDSGAEPGADADGVAGGHGRHGDAHGPALDVDGHRGQQHRGRFADEIPVGFR
jgi:hypothetical protein